MVRIWEKRCSAANDIAESISRKQLADCWLAKGAGAHGSPRTGRREVEGAEEGAEAEAGGDPWAAREFHIKWRRWSYIHTSWDTLATLSQLAGYKRVTNYIKRTKEAEVRRRPPAGAF